MKFLTCSLLLGISQLVSADPGSSALVFEPPMLSLSAVKNEPAAPASLTIRNPGPDSADTTVRITGPDAAAFKTSGEKPSLAPGEAMEIKVAFTPLRGFALYQASLSVGDSESGEIPVRGIGINAFEGKNEPPLQLVLDALGIPVNAGGRKLELDVKAASIGDSLPSKRFRGVPGAKVRVTPLARFSPPGVTPFGWVVKEGELHEIGRLAGSDGRPDNHQSLFPLHTGGAAAIEFTPPGQPFAFYMKGHLYTAFTDPGLPNKASIPHTVRVYPVTSFQGKPMEHACLVACEEASNGDYQDAVFLLENVIPE